MAPEVRMTLAAAQIPAVEGQAESQDSQAVMLAMHRFHGVGVTSSSPVDPLEYDQDLIQHVLQHPRLRGIHQQDTSKSSKSKSKSKSDAANAEARQQSNKDKHPALAAMAPASKGSGQDKGLDSPGGHAGGSAAAAANLIPSSQARSTDASMSIDRVSLSSHQTQSQTGVTSARPTGLAPGHPDETIASSLSSTEPVGSQCVVTPALLPSLGNDATGSRQPTPTSRCSVRSIPQTYKRGRRKKNKMDFSQSPTQSNDGRSYEQYLPRGDDLIPSNATRQSRLSHPPGQSSPASTHTNTSPQDDDTARVDLDFSALARRDTQISVPDSTRTGATTQQRHHATLDYVFGNPETLAAPRNPFLGSKAAALMGSSQMFIQTQYSSAIKATFSPTSSRPSPDNLHLNSISPNPSPLKRIALGPSPLQGASSLPQLPLVYDTSSQQADEDDMPPYEDEIARSHVSKSFRLPPQPALEEYRPIQRWETRAASAQWGSDAENDSDEDMSDEEERRRQRVALKKAKARRRLETIKIVRPSDEVIVPATNQGDASPAAQQYLDQCDGISRSDSQTSIEDLQNTAQNIADSQDGIVQLAVDLSGQPSANEGISSNDIVPNTDPVPASVPIQTDDDLAAQVPETSPARSWAPGDIRPHSSGETPEPGSLGKLLNSPVTATVADRYLGSTSRPSQQRMEDAIIAGRDGSGVDADNNAGGPCISVSSSPPAPAFSTRARLRKRESPATAPASFSSTSPLSRLTTTPALSNETTPLTERSPRTGLPPSSASNDAADSSPAVAKAHRQESKPVSKLVTKPVVNRVSKMMSKSVSKPALSKLRASTRQTTRQFFPSNVSVSTDELAGSPRRSPPTFEQSTRMSRLGRTSLRESPASRAHSHGGAKLFEGMAFAISFQGKQPGEKDAHYKARVSISISTTTKIKQAGGKVLPDGFDHLFEFAPVKNADRQASSISSTPQPDDDIALAPQAQDTGFTALIADGHSRKAKYMQALALGLPCIHERWITACVEKNRLVDWADYLLCAGNSSFLGDAIRSRNLPPYDAASAKLSEVIQYRPRLLNRSRILLLMARADESKKAAYIFLARVLGASLSRVYNVDEARRQLKAREDAGRAFDWVYVVDEKVNVEDIFEPAAAVPVERGRKRKRNEVGKGGVSVGPPSKRVRALSDELVIQSLILGRLMEEEEMEIVAG